MNSGRFLAFVALSSLLSVATLSVPMQTTAQTVASAPVVYDRTFKTADPGEVQVRLTARAPGCHWGKAGAESAVATLLVDDAPIADVVLYGGSEFFPYDIHLGQLPAGVHTFRVQFRPDLSPPGATTVVVDKTEFRRRGIDLKTAAPNPAPRARDEALAARYAPILFGRPDNATSDVPLLLYYEVTEAVDSIDVGYTVIWSNEDGGTGENLGSLLSRWGRTSDIEWIYTARLRKAHSFDPQRKRNRIDYLLDSATYQGPGHKTLPFQGTYRDGHALLYTVTTNNMVADAPAPGVSASPGLRFALVPFQPFDSTRATRETMMDAARDAHKIAALEMQREGKLETNPDPQQPAASDLRNYLYVDYRAECSPGALLYVQVRLNDGRTFVSHHGRTGDAVGRSGWVRTSVELPAKTPESEIAAISFGRADATPATALVHAVSAMTLNNSYRPNRPLFQSIRTLPVTRENKAMVFEKR